MPVADPLLARAAERLRAGGIVVFPTDTVTGIGCLARDPGAVAGVFALKGRDPERPLILFLADAAEVESVTGPLPGRVRRLLELGWPGAFTAILPSASRWPEGVGRAGTIGIRVPGHPVARALVSVAGLPLATTSANRSGERPWRDSAEASTAWGDRVFVLPGVSGEVASTVADLTTWPPRILREGAIGASRFEEWVRAAG